MVAKNGDTLRDVGLALFGPAWQTALADALGVSDRTIRYWVGGKDIPEGVWGDLAAVCRKRGKALEAWAAKLG